MAGHLESNIWVRLTTALHSRATREVLLLHLRASARATVGTLVVVYLCLVSSTFFLPPRDPGVILSEDPNFYVDTATGRVKDSFGRERIFHGVNVVFKGRPWLPQTDGFDPQLSFSDEDIEILKQLGLNVVRLGVMWPGVHPERAGVVNQTYLVEVRKIVQKLHEAGIYTLVDFHQDVFGSRFCGEGVPDWLMDDTPYFPNTGSGNKSSRSGSLGNSGGEGLREQEHVDRDAILSGVESTDRSSSNSILLGMESANGSRSNSSCGRRSLQDIPCIGYAVCMKPEEYAASFPEPLHPRFGRTMDNPDDPGQVHGHIDIARLLQQVQQREEARSSWQLRQSFPSEAQCRSIEWGIYHFSFAVSRAFQDLYENRWGWRDRLAEYWVDVATALKGEDGVLGFDLMNEPWVGDIFLNPLLMAPGVADRLNYAPLYEHLQAVIRKADASRLLFFESTTFDNFVSGFLEVPGGEGYANMSVISYHYYHPPNVAPRATFLQREAEQKRLKCGWMLTEFGIPNRRPDWLNSAPIRNEGKLEQGIACLPVRSEEERAFFETSQKRSASFGGRVCSEGKTGCAGASAVSWKEFVEAWGAESNMTRGRYGRGNASLTARFSACAKEERGNWSHEDHTQEAAVTVPKLSNAAVDRDSSPVFTQIQVTHLAGLESNLEDSVRESAGIPRGDLTGHAKEWRQEGSDSKPNGLHLSHRPLVSREMETQKRGSKALELLLNGLPVDTGGVQEPLLKDGEGVRPKPKPSLSSGADSPEPGTLDEMVETISLADEYVQSWIAWEYKPYVPLTGTNYGLFDATGTLNQLVVKFFWRTYPVAVAGSIQSFSFDPYKSLFKMVYRASQVDMRLAKEKTGGLLRRHVGSALAGSWRRAYPFWGITSLASREGSLARTTEIFVCCSRNMTVQVQPDVATEWTADGRFLRLLHDRRHDGLEINVVIRPA